MKKIIVIISVYITMPVVVTLSVYLMASLVFLSINYNCWESEGRLAFFILSPFSWWYGLLLAEELVKRIYKTKEDE